MLDYITMNSKERFQNICNHHQPDRVPIDYLAHPKLDKAVRERLGCDTEEELLNKLGCDFYYLSCRDISQNESFLKCYKGHDLRITEKERICALGIRWLRGAYDSKFSVDETIGGPLENVTSESDILNHNWPKADDFDFSLLLQECEAHSDKTIIGGLWTGIMGDAYRLYGFQNFLMDIALKPKFIKTLVNKMTDLYMELNEAYFSSVKGKMDIWFFGNDFGSQNGLLISRDMWLEFFFENIKKLTNLAHSYGLKVMMHSCGAISEIIPYLIEAGVDILDPIQVTASGMEPNMLSDKFSDKMIFHGGIDTQQVLPYSDPEIVATHAEMVIKILGKRNGYIFAPSQILGEDIPVENIIAMYKAANSL